MFAQLLGADDPHAVQMRINQAALLFRLGRFADAEPLYKLALAAREKTLGPDHPETAETSIPTSATSMRASAALPRPKGTTRARLPSGRVLGPAHIDCARPLFALGRMNIAQGRYLTPKNC